MRKLFLAGAAGATTRQHPEYLDFKQAVIARRATSPQGTALGTVSDLVVERASGKIDYVLIRSGGLGLGNAPQAIPWNAVAQLPEAHDRPLVLNLGKQQLSEAPFFGMKAPLQPQAPNPNDVMNKVPPSGDNGMTPPPGGH